MDETSCVPPFFPKILKSAGNSVGLDYPAPPKWRLELAEGFPVSRQMHQTPTEVKGKNDCEENPLSEKKNKKKNLRSNWLENLTWIHK